MILVDGENRDGFGRLGACPPSFGMTRFLLCGQCAHDLSHLVLHLILDKSESMELAQLEDGDFFCVHGYSCHPFPEKGRYWGKIPKLVPKIFGHIIPKAAYLKFGQIGVPERNHRWVVS